LSEQKPDNEKQLKASRRGLFHLGSMAALPALMGAAQQVKAATGPLRGNASPLAEPP